MHPDNQKSPTVEMSLEGLSVAIAKAVEDLSAVRSVIDRARADIGSRNTSVPRDVIAAAERAIDHLKRADEALRDVVKDLAERD